MKILFTRFPLESAHGGAERQIVSLMRGLIEKGHDVTFLGSCLVLLRLCTALRITHYALRIGNPPVTKWDAISFVWRKRTMQQQLIQALTVKIQDPRALCMVSLTEKMLLTPYALQRGIRVLWIEHDSVGKWLTWNPWLSALRKMSNDVTTICVSEMSAELYRKLGFRNVIAIPNGGEVGKLGSGEMGKWGNWEIEKWGNGEIGKLGNREVGKWGLRIGCIARLSHEKGVDILIDAVKDLPDIEVMIFGRGPEERRLQKMLRHKKLERCIQIRSHVKDIEEIYRSIDVLILPSRSNDPFGLVVAEAMLRGIPTICTDACGISGYLRNGMDAIVIPAKSESALREAILKMFDRGLRTSIGRQGKKTAEEKFTIEKMVDRYRELLM